jgi:inner membrane protein
MGKTHMLCGMSFAVGASLVMRQPINPVWLVLSTVGSLVPDIDHEFSMVSQYSPDMPIIGKRLKPFHLIAKFMHHTFGHRTITHSLLGLAIWCAITLPLGIWVDWGWWFAFAVLGYTSHLISDSCTISGVMWFYPFIKTHYGSPLLKIRTGSGGEKIFSLVVAFLTGIMIIISLWQFGLFHELDHGMTLIKNSVTKLTNYLTEKTKEQLPYKQ